MRHIGLLPRPPQALLGLACALILVSTGCGLFGGPSQLKQLQAENDKLVGEYRALRDKLAKVQEENTVAQQRLAEAEKLLARSGNNVPSTRLSQVPNRTSAAAPPYIPPQPGTSSEAIDPKWRPMRRQ